MTIGRILAPKKANDFTVWNEWVKERTDDEQVKQWIYDTVVVIGHKSKLVKKNIWDNVMLSDGAKDKCNMLINGILKLQDGLITESEYRELSDKIIDLFFSRIMKAKYGEIADLCNKRYVYYKLNAFSQSEALKKYIVKNFTAQEEN